MLGSRFVRTLICAAAVGFIACYLLLDKMSNLTDLKMMPWSEFSEDPERVDKWVANYNAKNVRRLQTTDEVREAYEAYARKSTAVGKSPMFDRANARIGQFRTWWDKVYASLTITIEKPVQKKRTAGAAKPRPAWVIPGMHVTLAALFLLIVATTIAKGWAWRKARV